MIDRAKINVRSGNGGSGAVSGRREKFVPRGGPDGGHGGDGGSVYMYADPNISTLAGFRYTRRFSADHGERGRGGLRHGSNGADVEIPVPVGTEVRLAGEESSVLADLDESLLRVQVARGGRGGRGNSAFASSTNRFPLLAEEGESGEEFELVLELKLLADVGIVGAPNAGKSSLLTAVSAARPKVADYPFTTLEPVLGVVEHLGESFVMVDIPGLIEGAHEGVGLGHEFLKHIERTRVLVHLVDGSVDSPAAQMMQIDEEIRLYDQGLAERPRVVAVNKIDLPGVRGRIRALEAEFSSMGVDPMFVSAATTEGLHELLSWVLERNHKAESSPGTSGQSREGASEVPVLRPSPKSGPIHVAREDGAYVVLAPEVLRVAAMVDAGDWNARMQFHSYLKRMGVLKALESAGAAPGDTVVIGSVEWEWE